MGGNLFMKNYKNIKDVVIKIGTLKPSNEKVWVVSIKYFDNTNSNEIYALNNLPYRLKMIKAIWG